ncbi:MAG: bacillithiol biosynthesis protein BshC [Thermoanaerobaculaceae bacterium]
MKSDQGSTDRLVATPLSLDRWEPPHPVARAIFTGTFAIPEPSPYSPGFRHQQLAVALAELNRRWGNPVDRQLAAWLAGARVVVSGQQPGLLGGPLLSLIKACALAAQVARLQAEGHEAVGFFWLETRDDDLPEMGWARLALAGELYAARKDWRRGQTCACAIPLSSAAYDLLDTLPLQFVSPSGRKALDLARASFQPGMALGEACGRFFGRLLSGLGVVLVDASIREVAFAAHGAAARLLDRLPRGWELLGCMPSFPAIWP